MFERANPIELRKSLDLVELFKLAGVDFIPIPVKDKLHKQILLILAEQSLDEILKLAEMED